MNLPVEQPNTSSVVLRYLFETVCSSVVELSLPVYKSHPEPKIFHQSKKIHQLTAAVMSEPCKVAVHFNMSLFLFCTKRKSMRDIISIVSNFRLKITADASKLKQWVELLNLFYSESILLLIVQDESIHKKHIAKLTLVSTF